MNINDPVGDMLTRIRNGQKAKHDLVACPYSSFRQSVLDVLKREGYIYGYDVRDEKTKKFLDIQLKYRDSVPCISFIKRVSKPGKRLYSPIARLKKVYNGLGISVLSTPRGVLSDIEARHHHVGGEVLCHIF